MRFPIATLKIVAVFTAILLLVFIAIAASVGLADFLEQQKDRITSRDTAITLLAAFLWVVQILILLGVSLGIVWVCRCIFRSRDLFGMTQQARLLGLGVTALIFPEVLYQVVIAPVWVFDEILRRMPLDTQNPILDSASDPIHLANLTKALLTGLQTYLSKFGDLLRRLLEWLNISGLILALALWSLVGHTLSETPSTSEHGRVMRLTTFLRGLAPPQKRALVLSGLFLASAYLSIAAMVSIPWLQQKGSASPVSNEQLKSTLERNIMLLTDFDRTYPSKVLPPVIDGLDALQATANALQAEIERLKSNQQSYSNYWNELLDDVRELTSNSGIRLMAANFTQAWEDLRSQAHEHERNSLNTALTSFETKTLSPMSVQEKAVYVETLERWFNRGLRDYYDNLRDCKHSAGIWQTTVQTEIHNSTTALRRALEMARDSKRMQDFMSPSTYIVPPPTSSTTAIMTLTHPRFTGCTPPPLNTARPEPPDPGLGLGPFGLVSSWLVRTKSLALVLITGMLGFGLLGATISSFVRSKEGSVLTEPTLGELGGVLVRGLSAAVIVYLAVKGGLAAYAVGETEPNAYVLFFTCLIGATFSERVWDWSRAKLEGQLPTEASSQQVSVPNTLPSTPNSVSTSANTTLELNQKDAIKGKGTETTD
ncbi:MAG: hypothetical protein A4E19_03195 [Nitrospira sp. SG-bin1]|nr:MAG: hypothetical protein A4E19_03195 [Nitrospira sp. SG-bin1]